MNLRVPLRDLVICLGVTLIAFLLIAPLFQAEYLDNWGSIDSTFIADARFLSENWLHPHWQPLWYCGTRFDYIYPPALRYGTAALSKLLQVSTARSYHVYTALLYCIGIAGIFALVRSGGLSWQWAAISALAIAVMSPSFLFLSLHRADSALHMPQRLNALIKWGEGPHISALSILPFALFFSWRALHKSSAPSMALAALCSAMVVSHNFYGATSLVLFFGLLVWCVWINLRDRNVFLKASVIAALAYGLTAFWLTPSYLQITVDNLKLVAQPGNTWSRWIFLALIIVFGVITWRISRRRPGSVWTMFVAGSVVFLSVIVIGHSWFGFRVVGEPHRLVPELDLALTLGAVEVLRHWRSRARILAGAVVIGAFAVSFPYISKPWSVIANDPNYRQRPEFQTAQWISQHMPDARTFATGSLRLWFNAWHNGSQVGGGSEQGLLNPLLALAQWQVMKDVDVGRDIAWLQATGADLVAVPQPGGDAMFLEFPAPNKFDGVLPLVWDDGRGTRLYRVPRRFPSRARIVVSAEAERLKPVPYSEYNKAEIEEYARLLEHGPDRPLGMWREGPDVIRLRGELSHGESIIVQESFDPAWHAYNSGQAVPVVKDAAGFMRVVSPPGPQDVKLIFETPAENLAGGWITAITGVITGLLLFRR